MPKGRVHPVWPRVRTRSLSPPRQQAEQPSTRRNYAPPRTGRTTSTRCVMRALRSRTASPEDRLPQHQRSPEGALSSRLKLAMDCWWVRVQSDVRCPLHWCRLRCCPPSHALRGPLLVRLSDVHPGVHHATDVAQRDSKPRQALLPGARRDVEVSSCSPMPPRGPPDPASSKSTGRLRWLVRSSGSTRRRRDGASS